jgi:DNA-binding winged helix-turn-helix (wHTH) protein
MLLRDGVEQPLIPRYFDLLVFLIERRADAVHRREIFDAVWADVIVSDSALSQAIRTIRRVLGDDDPRSPRFLRTVSRHGYQFVFAPVVEEEDVDAGVAGAVADQPKPAARPTLQEAAQRPADPFEPLLAYLRRQARTAGEEEEQRNAAEQLHTLGTAEALSRLGPDRDDARARALLRDTRWQVAGAGRVPVLAAPHAASVAWHLVRIRVGRAAGLAAARWGWASVGGGLAGLFGGAAGGVLLTLAPGSAAPPGAIAVLAAIGLAAGAVAGAGVGAGLACAETIMRSRRIVALTAGGAIGGGAVGLLVEMLARSTLQVVVGITLPVGGGLEGLAIGAAAGLAYACTTVGDGGLAAPRGRARVRTAMAMAAACACAALGLSLAGRPLVGGTIHAIAQASAAHEALLAPLGRMIGEPGFGPLTATLIGTGEGALFGLGLALGGTHGRRA